MARNTVQRLQLVALRTAKPGERIIGIIAEQLQPHIALALVRDAINPKRHLAKFEADTVLHRARDRQPSTVAVEGNGLLVAMQGNLDGDVAPWADHDLLPTCRRFNPMRFPEAT
jgi:hypothetical protein